VLEQVLRTISRYYMLADGARAGVAVSGGADSVALLHVLARLGWRRGWTLEVLHFDHRLRGADSDADRRFVEELAAGMGLACHVECADVRAAAQGANLEQTARQMRYKFFAEMRARRGLEVVATGHTASDQAETVLLRVLRGAGAESLAGIRPVNDGWVVRPLIEVTREEVRQWLRSEGLEWREDASNADICYDRNRIRHELLPLLRREWNPAVEEALARLAGAFARDEEWWAQQTEVVWREAARRCRWGVILDTKALGRAHPALQVRVLKKACAEAAGVAPRIEGEHLETLLALVRQRAGAGKASLPGVRAWRSFGQVLIHPADQAFGRPAEVELGVPGAAALEGAGTWITLRLTHPGAEAEMGKSDLLDGARASGPFVLREWRDGDAYRPLGIVRAQTLQALLQRRRVLAWERNAWPVLVWQGRIVWARKFGVAADYAAESGCRRAIEIAEKAAGGANESNIHQSASE
jgi:tRNA(Ile)-lysidine synthase